MGDKAERSKDWLEQRQRLEDELDFGAMIVAMTDATAMAGGHVCTVTLATPNGRLIELAAEDDLLVGICRCSTSEMR